MDYDYTRNKLRALFDQTGLTQKDFAQMCGLTQSTVTRLLSGKRSPQLITLVKICQAFKVKPSFFVRELQEDELNPMPVVSDPLQPYGPLARAIFVELQSLDEEDLGEILEFARFRKRQGKRKKA